MLINHSLKQLKDISKTSLWIIMDPYDDQGSMVDADGTSHAVPGLSISTWNSPYLTQIFNYTSIMTHKIVVMDDIADSPAYMKKYLWISHSNDDGYTIIANYMKEKNLDKIIYCGFHEQRCIINRPLGYLDMMSEYECYIEWNLSCPFPDKDWRLSQSIQRSAEIYKYINMKNLYASILHKRRITRNCTSNIDNNRVYLNLLG